MYVAEAVVEVGPPYGWAATSREGIRGGILDLQARGSSSPEPSVVMEALRGFVKKGSTVIAVLPLQQCVIRRIRITEGLRTSQITEAIRIQMVRALRTGDVVIDWDRVNGEVVAAACPVRVSAAIEEAAQKAGLKLVGIEPVPFPLLRAVAPGEAGVIAAVHIAGPQALLAIGSVKDFYLARQLLHMGDTLALDVEQTITQHEREGNPGVSEILVSGREDTGSTLVEALTARVNIPVRMVSVHPEWRVEAPSPELVHVVGALLEPRYSSETKQTRRSLTDFTGRLRKVMQR